MDTKFGGSSPGLRLAPQACPVLHTYERVQKLILDTFYMDVGYEIRSDMDAKFGGFITRDSAGSSGVCPKTALARPKVCTGHVLYGYKITSYMDMKFGGSLPGLRLAPQACPAPRGGTPPACSECPTELGRELGREGEGG